MSKAVVDIDLLKKYFLNPDGKSYGKITSRELKDRQFHMSDDLAEALNSNECYDRSETERVCLGRLNSDEVDQFLRGNPDVGLNDLFVLQELELETGTPLFTQEATRLVAKRFSQRVDQIYHEPEITQMRREVHYDPVQKKKVFAAKFNYSGQAMELINGGIRFKTSVWDSNQGESGAMEDVEFIYYHADLWVTGQGDQLLADPMVHTRFVPALNQVDRLPKAMEKILDEGVYQLEVQGRADGPDAPVRDLPVMVLFLEDDVVIFEAYRFKEGSDQEVVKVHLLVDLSKLDQEKFYRERSAT